MRKTIITTLLTATSLAFASIPDSATNPDPSYIKISTDGKSVTLAAHGLDENQPSQDTINLQWVFKHYPHADINMDSGIYQISETIEAPGYQGVIKGDGKNSTFIVGRGYKDNNNQYIFPVLSQDLAARYYPSSVPGLIWFHAVDGQVNDWDQTAVKLTMKDLTVKMQGLGPEVTLYGAPFRSVWAMLTVTGYDAVLANPQSKIDHVEVKFSNVGFEGETSTYQIGTQTITSSNAAAALVIFGGELWFQEPAGLNGWDEADHKPVNGVLSVKDCSFKNLHQYAVGPEAFFVNNTTSSYQFPTSPAFTSSSIDIKDNVFENVGGGIDGLPTGYGILLLSPSETNVAIKDNQFIENKGIAVAMLRGIRISMPEKVATVVIADNVFNDVYSNFNQATIAAFDLSFINGTPLKVNIKDNTFNGGAGFNKPFIEHSMGAGLVVSDNVFTGSAYSAISTGATISPFPPTITLPTVQDYVKNNNFSQLNASVKNIILGEGSSYCVVKTGSLSDVSDAGTGNTVVISTVKK